MSLIGEAEIGSPLLQAALSATPETTLHVEDIRPVNGEVRMMVHAEGGDFDAFETGLEDDATVATYRFIAAVDGRRLYRVTLSEYGQSRSTYGAALEQDIVVIDQRVTLGGVVVQARLPDRSALAAYRETCRRLDIPFEVTRLYTTTTDGQVDQPFGVTDSQREALLHALDAGYFDVPRGTDLQTMAETLEVSPQALSARLRRAQRVLITNTLSRVE